ncbi:hypothetical protein [Pseudoalteromonas nigrifaciens]|uniref:hypothetical protein n=1 Tax=Pseudoalteromonas nigrifaciens TaxID=28109 RepID=UPI003FD30A3D
MTDKDNTEINDALNELQNEWDEGDSSPVINDDSSHDDILDGLPDDEIATSDIETDNNQKANKKKNKPQKVKVPKKESKSNGLLFKLLIGAGVVSLVGFMALKSDRLTTGGGTSLPTAGGWELFGSDKAEQSPKVTQEQLELVISQLRNDVNRTLKQLPTVEQVESIRRDILDLQRIQSNQSASIRSLNSLADKPSSQRGASNDIDGQISLIRAELDNLNSFTGELLSKTAELDAQTGKFKNANKQLADLVNSNWSNHLRINKLENKLTDNSDSPSTSASNGPELKKAEAITLKSKNEWALKIVSQRFTQIYNTQTGKNLRVFEGVVIPNCGPVIDIDVAARKVTAQHCTIGRN